MQAQHTVTPNELPEILLGIAPVRPVFVWGPPGIGKSTLVNQFAEAVNMPCVTLLGTQLAPEDLIGIPRLIETRPGIWRSEFCPPALIARDDPFVLFLDELNGASHEVQRAMYSLILDRRLGTWDLHPASVIIAAGNRSQDQAIVRNMSSALMNRMVHITLEARPTDWLTWAETAGVHPWVTDYIRQRADHLVTAPPKSPEPFSTPRSWHALSDGLHSFGDDVTERQVELLASGCLTPAHALSFVAFTRTRRHAYALDKILTGDQKLPASPDDRDILLSLAAGLGARLAHDLPGEAAGLNDTTRRLAHNAKRVLAEIIDINNEVAQVVINGDKDLPAWFLAQIVRDIPRLVAPAGD